MRTIGGRRTPATPMWRSALALLPVFAVACEAPGDLTKTDAATTDAEPRARDASPLPDAPPVLCEGGVCGAAPNTPLEETACCSESGACGLMSRALSPPACLPPDEPGGVSLECAALALPGVPTLQGCCTPAGTCGAYDRFGGFGCIPNERFGTSADRCEPEQVECRAITEIPCDGAEDCADGESCCGRLQSDLYDRFGCFPSCSTISDAEGGLWFPICHSDSDCPKSTDRCTAAIGLPPFLGRCYPNGEAAQTVASAPGVACGEIACAEAEKCCIRDPGSPYCAPIGQRCTCSATTSTDAGGTPIDAGRTDAAPRDASLDAIND